MALLGQKISKSIQRDKTCVMVKVCQEKNVGIGRGNHACNRGDGLIPAGDDIAKQ